MNKGDRVVVTDKVLLSHEANKALENVECPEATVNEIAYGPFGMLYLINLDGYKHEQVLPPRAVRKLEGENDEL